MKGSLKIHGPLGVILFTVAFVMLGEGQEPFTTYFYAFAWWSYILAADSFVFWARGKSLIINKFPAFLVMILLSIFIWCIFEALNLRLTNWHYINVPREIWLRWIGFAISYGTVLPGLCETLHLLQVVRTIQSISWRRQKFTPSVLHCLIVLGVIFLLTAILFPRIFFPVVWIGPALILEPLCHLRGDDSLLMGIERGDYASLLNLLAAGFVCGFLWEFWNYGALTKWIYTVPFFEKMKLFEMPLLGFFGFPPFAVSAYALYRYLAKALQKSNIRIRVTLWLLTAFFTLITFAGIDRFTIACFVPRIKDLPGVQEKHKASLQDAGIKKVHDLLVIGVQGIEQRGISHFEAMELMEKADIITMKGIGIDNFRLLEEAGVKNVFQLAQQDSRLLYLRIQEKTRLQTSPHRTPTLSLVRLWVNEAQKKGQ